VEQLGEDKAPPHRWFLIGPKRSGSEVHNDPLGTSAWNTSVAGHKRWVMMPPTEGISKQLVRGEHLRKKNEDDEAIQYFDKILPRLKEMEGPKGTNRLPEIIECI
jgi:histone arginine demethylase JMJD6